VGGAADRAALALGNALVGNPPGEAALEVTLAGPTLRASHALACVLFGAPFALSTPCRALRAGTTFTLEAGEELHAGGTAAGARGYLCVAGGLLTPRVLGSRSSLQPLQAGDLLPCTPGTIHGRFLSENVHEVPGGDAVLRFLDGPQASWFPEDALTGRPFTVSADSNRMGLRLEGEPLPVPGRELVSEPVCPGTVQVTRDGRCIVLGVDAQTIGGYPKVACVIAADIDRVGQLRPGAAVRFERITLEEAEDLGRRRREWLGAWVRRVRAAGGASVGTLPGGAIG
jgi:antagonist of KipI